MPHCRCRRCGARRTLRRNPENYLRPPPCRNGWCARNSRARGLKPQWTVDRYREHHETGTGAPTPCRCRGGHYPFPHRRGSKWCEHNPNWDADDASERFDSGIIDHGAWRSDPLCFGRRPTTSTEPPF